MEGLTLCEWCLDHIAVWLLNNSLADENPFAEELFSDPSETESYMMFHGSGWEMVRRVPKIFEEKS